MKRIRQSKEKVGVKHKKSYRAFKELEEKFKALVSASPDSITVTDLMGNITDVSEGAVQIYHGKTIKDLLGKNAFELIAPQDRQRAKENLEKTLTQGVMRNLEYTLYRKDGSTYIGELSSSIIKDYSGKPKAFVAAVRDITARRKAEMALQESYDKLQKAFDSIIKILVRIVEIKDPYTAGHQRRVAQLVGDICLEMGLPENDINSICIAAIIHDIGKIYVPTEILSKPYMLTEVEYNMVKSHSQASYDILRSVEFPWPIDKIVYQHHERMDGSGYPLGLKGNDILLGARILGVADVVEAMTYQRPYRSAMGVKKALDEIVRNKDILYDSKVVDACLKVFANKGYSF